MSIAHSRADCLVPDLAAAVSKVSQYMGQSVLEYSSTVIFNFAVTILNYFSVRFLQQVLLGNFKFCIKRRHRSGAFEKVRSKDRSA